MKKNMMNLNNLQIFKSNGLPITLQVTHLLTFKCTGGNGSSAEGSMLIEKNGEISHIDIINEGRYSLSEYAEYDESTGLYKDPLHSISSISVFFSGTLIGSIDSENFNFYFKSNSYNLGYQTKEYFSLHKIELTEDIAIKIDPVYYPGVLITGNLDLEPVSCNLVSSETLFILERGKELDDANKYSFYRPISKNQSIRFALNNDSIRFVSSDYVSESLSWENRVTFDLTEDPDKANTPLSFSVGFLGDVEGVYEEFMQIYLIDHIVQEDGTVKNEFTNIGNIHIGAEAIDEDERFRSLFTNFGVPDPVTYPTLFKEMDPKEDGINWDFINKKSKELFLTYDQIFPYTGTYKALINAVNFLGYNDIVFKEWFKYTGKNSNNKEFLTYKSLDLSLGESLASKLQKMNLQEEGIDSEGIWKTWLDYKKLNKISMHYLINKETGDNEVIKGVTSHGSEANEFIYEIPETINTYEYSNEEVLIKLFALRDWLEKYIIGVNCKITDLTGEGIYFERFKNPAYSTHHYVVDYIKNIPITPIPIIESEKDFEMIDSSAIIRCSLKEFDELTLKDYEQISFEQFLVDAYSLEASSLKLDREGNKHIVSKGYFDSEDGQFVIDKFDAYNALHFPISAPFNAPILFNEIEYTLDIKSTSGTILHSIKRNEEFLDNPLLIRSNEISFYNDDAMVCDFERCPMIQIGSGVFRKKYGSYDQSVVYRVSQAYDEKNQTARYMMYRDSSLTNGYDSDYGKYSRSKIVSYDYITLVPRKNASFKYEISPKYEVPLFYIKNYDVIVYNTEVYGENGERIVDASSSCYLGNEEFILDIYNGSISCDEGENIEALITFDDQHIDIVTGKSEQSINPEYLYYSDKVNPWKFDVSKFADLHGSLVLSMTEQVNALKNSILASIEEFNYITDASRDASLEYIASKNSSNPEWVSSNDSDYQYVISEASAWKQYNQDNAVAAFEHIKNRIVGNYELNKAEAIKNCYTINKIVDVCVNHIGTYDLGVNGWDQFGNVYINQNQEACGVYASAPSILPASPYIDSRNSSDFYPINSYGSLLDIINQNSSFYVEFMKNSSPKFLPLYRIYGIESLNDEEFTYPSISYVLDSPKKNDIILLDNLTERVTKIEFDYKISIVGESYEKERVGLKLYILDESPSTNNVFAMDASINLYFYDPTKLDLYTEQQGEFDFKGVSGKYIVKGFYKVINDNNEQNDNYIQLVQSESQFDELTDELISKVNTGKIRCFASNVTEWNIDIDSIENDYEAQESSFLLEDSLIKQNFLFKKGQVVKIIIGADKELGNKYIDDYVAEAAFRIKKVELVNIAPLDEFGEPSGYVYRQKYTLDGIINKELITTDWYNYSHEGQQIEYNSRLKCRMAYANLLYSRYPLMVKEDANEYRGISTIKFDNSNLFGNYIDSTYSFFVSKFYPEDAEGDWLKSYNKMTNLYEFEHPITIGLGNQYSISSRYLEKRHLKQYKSIWEFYNNDDLQNLKESPLRWQVTNDRIFAKSFAKGAYQFKLTAIDKYGNEVVNQGEAIINVI